MKNYILLAIAILAGVLAFGISKLQIQQEYVKMKLAYEQIPVLGYKHDMLKGDPIREEDIGKRPIFKRDYFDEVLPTKLNEVLDQKLAMDVKKDEPMKWRHLAWQAKRVGLGSEAARTIPEGERALSIPVDSISAVSNLIDANDRVDIIASFRFPDQEGRTSMDTVTLTLLQNVTLLAVGQKLAIPSRYDSAATLQERSKTYATVTVSVTPKEAELLVFAMQKGKLTLTLRHPEDVFTEKNVQEVNWSTVQTRLKEYQDARQQRIEKRK